MSTEIARHFVVHARTDFASTDGSDGASQPPRDSSRGTGVAFARASMVSRKANKPACVTVVSKNADTLTQLLAYFQESGVATHGSRTVRNTVIAPATTAVVLFPDDFADRDVVALVNEVRRSRPRVLLVIVTRAPRKLEAVLAPDGRSVPPLVLPRPSFGWSILDAIRARDKDPDA